MTPVSENRKSFTLIELILVIIIMGIVYSFIGNSLFKKENSITITLKNLPEVARDLNIKPLKFIIFGRECSQMVWLDKDGNSINVKYGVSINSRDLKPYRFNFYGELEQFEFIDFRFENRVKKVCLEFEFFKNSSNSSYILEDEKKDIFYLFKPYFKSVQTFKSLEEAKDIYLSEELNPSYL